MVHTAAGKHDSRSLDAGAAGTWRHRSVACSSSRISILRFARSTGTKYGAQKYIRIEHNVHVATRSSQTCEVLGPLITAFSLPRGNRASWVSDTTIVTPHPAVKVAVGNTHPTGVNPGTQASIVNKTLTWQSDAQAQRDSRWIGSFPLLSMFTPLLWHRAS